MTSRPLWIVPGTRPLYFDKGRLFCSQFDRIVSTVDYGQSFTEECDLEAASSFRPLIKALPLAQRAARASVYRMCVLSDGTKIIIFRGGVWVQQPGERKATRTWEVTKGSRPVSLAAGADDLVLFGEYWGNPDLEAVCIFGSRDRGRSWETVFTFAPGEIRHVHGIAYDHWENCFWVCTGDLDSQNQLLRASADFGTVRIVRQGGQGNRFFAILVTERALITATDTPHEDNHICAIDRRTGELTRVAAIENTSFFMCVAAGKFFVSTNAEPSEINDVEACHVWMGDTEPGSWRRIMTFPRDAWSRISFIPGVPNLFQYPQVFFPEGENPGETLVCHGTGLKGYDGAMLCYDARGWDS